MKIGLITDCTKLPLDQAIVKAAELGAEGVQIYATTGTFSPDMTPSARDFYKKLIADNGLEVSALCGDMGGTHFEKRENNALKVEKTKRIIDLAQYFGTNVVTTHIGSVPDDPDCEQYAVMLEAALAMEEFDGRSASHLRTLLGRPSAGSRRQQLIWSLLPWPEAQRYARELLERAPQMIASHEGRT